MAKINLVGTRHRHRQGDFVLLQPVSHKVTVGTATASRNELTGDWLVGSYIVADESTAIRLALTVDHFNRTGERKKFPRSAYAVTWR